MDVVKGDGADIDEKDFLERADMITALGHKPCSPTVQIMRCLLITLAIIKYQSRSHNQMRELQSIITDKYTQNQNSQLLVAFGDTIKTSEFMFIQRKLPKRMKSSLPKT